MSNPTWHMRRAIRLATKARGYTLPNPIVGAVIVKNGEKIGEGYHKEFGADHAEIDALKNCTENPKGATLYVTLEPCCHHGKTPPCTKAIIEAGISKVYLASTDPSEKIQGKGIIELQEAGIEVELGLLKDEAEKLNPEFYTYHRAKRPFITLKVATSIDGKVAKGSGIQTKLTSKQAQKNLHILRSQHQAILIGAGTAKTDNPILDSRLVQGKDPIRIILEGKEKLDKNLKIFRDENYILYKEKNLNEVIEDLYQKGIVSVLVEGGPKVHSAFIKSKLVDQFKFYIAPIILGSEALSFLEYTDELSLSTQSVQKLGPDVLITATAKWDSNNG